LPDDPTSPEFWQAIQKARGAVVDMPIQTFDAAVDAWLMSLRVAGDVTVSTCLFYEQSIRIGRAAWGLLEIKGLRPKHVKTLFDSMASKPGAANNFLASMRALSKWAKINEHIEFSLTEGISARPARSGHKPWTPLQIEIALKRLKGVVRQGVVLYLYTGMRGSDAVRVGPDHIDEGGFSYTTQKTNIDVYCPILPELQKEMDNWPKETGPFLKQEVHRAAGKPYTRKLFSKHFAEQRDDIPELEGVTLHGLRCTAVIRLRRAGLELGQISDIVGMSIPMIARYCRNQDKKASGKAALQTLMRLEKEGFAKQSKNGKRKPSKNKEIEEKR